MRPEYNDKFDYKAAHIAWVSNHPNFESKCYSTMPAMKINNLYIEKASYKEILVEWYLTSTNYIAYLNYYDDLRWLEDQKVIQKHLVSKPLETNCSFVTVGFDHREFTPKKGLEYVKALLNSDVVLIDSYAVMENHKSNGDIHPHVHFKLYWSPMFNGKPFYMSTLIQTIIRAKHGKKLIKDKNFVDIKPYDDLRHSDYLDLKKQSDKMPAVAKDIVWRSENNIPDKIYKDN